MTTLDPNQDVHLVLRNLDQRDYADIKRIMDKVYPGLGGGWPLKNYQSMLNRFPEGQICIEDSGKVVAAAFAVIVDYAKFGDDHTYEEITGNETLASHDADGDVLYGVDVFVDPDYRNLRLGRRLYEARKELCQNLNLRAIFAGGRIPGYQDHHNEMTPQQYIQAVKRRELYDPILSFQLANDFDVKQVIKGYLPDDQESKGYATLLEWSNIFYEAQESALYESRKSSARVGCIQWQMREMHSVEEVLQQVEYFVDALADYRCDVALFPEFFNAPLMGMAPDKTYVESIRFLASFSEQIRDEISRLAVSYNINVVAGSMPVIEDGELYNTAYVLHRDGSIEEQQKLHITPHEKRDWIMQGGSELKLFNMDFGKMGVLICYDVEFPELARLQSEQDMDLLLVPFWTDTKNGYLRVRRCAQARAIENECYVAIAGSIGNLPQVDSLDIQYAQTAVFSPSDFSFPHDAIMAETTPNTEMTLIVDIDLDKLQSVRNDGSVTNGKDRRHDLYRVEWIGKKPL